MSEPQAAAKLHLQPWIQGHGAHYLSSGGARGHIEDLSSRGGRLFAPHLLLRYVGRKTGKTYTIPLFYGVYGGEVVIVASKGGAPAHPAWYLNLTASDQVRFQVATQAFRGTWREPEATERDQLWKLMVSNHPAYADYQAKTSRRIPIILLQAVEEIPVFKPADAA
ncbi:MAG: nitroreductase family deazaflavin-dependent oxidoreductase [Caulobacteraceae bacterium]|nr:nitroreductase family deazaflavin-dependent oxidoreductase [Caulobacteraceae bacterium]